MEITEAVKYVWNVFGCGKYGAVGHLISTVLAATKTEAEALAVKLTPCPIVEINMQEYQRSKYG